MLTVRHFVSNAVDKDSQQAEQADVYERYAFKRLSVISKCQNTRFHSEKQRKSFPRRSHVPHALCLKQSTSLSMLLVKGFKRFTFSH